MNPYKVLGVEDNSTQEVCKKAFKSLCKKFHPDVCGSREKYDTIQEAMTLIESGYKVSIARAKLHHVSLFKFATSLHK